MKLRPFPSCTHCSIRRGNAISRKTRWPRPHYGDRATTTDWPDLSTAALERSHQLIKKVLADLARIPRASLPARSSSTTTCSSASTAPASTQLPVQTAGSTRFSHRESLPVAERDGGAIDFDTPRTTRTGPLVCERSAPMSIRTSRCSSRAMREKRTQPKSVMGRVPPQIAKQLVAEARRQSVLSRRSQVPR